MITIEARDMFKATAIGALAGVALGLIGIFVSPDNSHTLKDMQYFGGLIPMFAFAGAFIGFLAGRVFKKY